MILAASAVSFAGYHYLVSGIHWASVAVSDSDFTPSAVPRLGADAMRIAWAHAFLSLGGMPVLVAFPPSTIAGRVVAIAWGCIGWLWLAIAVSFLETSTCDELRQEYLQLGHTPPVCQPPP